MEGHRRAPAILLAVLHDLFQSLFLWKVIVESDGTSAASTGWIVSILVFMEGHRRDPLYTI